VVVIPSVYFVTILVVDYVLNSVRGLDAFDVADFNTPPDTHMIISDWQRLALVICAVLALASRDSLGRAPVCHNCVWLAGVPACCLRALNAASNRNTLWSLEQETCMSRSLAL
jgi:hypothetical protein